MKKTLKKPTTTDRATAKKVLTKRVKPQQVPVAEKPKKALVRPPAPTVRPKSGPKPIVPKGFKFTGMKDPRFKGHILVKTTDMPDTFPKAHVKCVPGTYYRVEKATSEVGSLVTVLPNGIHVAWVECGVCVNHVTRCICRQGFIHNRGIEWLFIKGLMDKDKLPMASEPKIDSTHMEVRARAVHWYMGKETAAYVPSSSYKSASAPQKAAQPQVSTQTPQKPAKPFGSASRTPATPPRKSLKKTGPQVDVSNVDLSKVNKDAASLADAATKQFEQMLNSKPVKKTLKKRK